MKLARRKFLHLATGAAALPALPRVAQALGYPNRPVRIIVGLPAGYATDLLARLTGQTLSQRLSQQFIVEDRPGASGNIAAEVVVRAAPDGYTLLQVNSGNAMNVTLYPNLNFNFMRDIAPVAGVGRTPFVMAANPSIPAKTIPEFIAYAKANPGKVNYASPGVGSTNHLFGELFKMMTGIDWVHVPYRASFVPDLLAGQVQVAFTPITVTIGPINEGKLRALAVTTTSRQEMLPDTPAMAEFVPGYEAAGWQGIGAPKNTPVEIVQTLSKAISASFADPATKERLVGLGFEPMPMSSAEFGKLIADETEKWGKVIRAAHIKVE